MFYIAVLCKMHVMLCWAAFQIQLQSRIFPTSSVETPRVWSCCQCGHHRINGITFHLLYDFLEHFVFPVWMCRSSQAFMFLKESICHWCWKILQRVWNGNMTFSFSTEDFAPLSSPWCYFVREIYWLSFFIFYLKGRDKDLVTGSLPSVHSNWDWPRPVRNQELIHDISLGWQGPKYLASHLSPCKVYIERKLSLRVESELQLGRFGGRCQQHLIHGCLMPALAGTFISLDKLVFCLLLIRFSFCHKFWIIGLWDFLHVLLFVSVLRVHFICGLQFSSYLKNWLSLLKMFCSFSPPFLCPVTIWPMDFLAAYV